MGSEEEAKENAGYADRVVPASDGPAHIPSVLQDLHVATSSYISPVLSRIRFNPVILSATRYPYLKLLYLRPPAVKTFTLTHALRLFTSSV
jgi:hypothetical protein